MRLGYDLTLQQTQKLVITPELRQAINILQFSTVELSEYLEQAVLENPVLELKDESPEETASTKEEDDSEQFDVDWQEYFQDGSDLGYIRNYGEKKEDVPYEQFVTRSPSLHDHLDMQLQLMVRDKKQKLVGEFLIGNIDDHGYLCVSVEEAAEQLNVPAPEVTEVLEIIQSMDPPGVGARDLVECLLIQLRQREEHNSLAEKIVRFHLDDLAAGRISKIAQKLRTSARQVQQASDLIKSLDPKPGRQFSDGQSVKYIIPDVVVERVEGEYIVLVNDVSMPRLSINPAYRAILQNASKFDAGTREFLETKLNAASWIIRSIEQRRLTLYRVVRTIVDMQREFFDHGIRYLRPLNLKQVADVLQIHESTVSRATANKYVQTPLGVFPLKFFFASGVNNAGGLATSSESIKKMIKEMIDGEDKQKPLSDQKITKLLNVQGIKISRRTVAKYRGELGIPAANKRRRY
ncbi:MAG: RNA polymerase factor sigma-54 [Thermoanaerobacteraceae bacterium]|nr:RNA polymerase factor sigma-54 [Thermoanaerobacteraceae bacterium]